MKWSGFSAILIILCFITVGSGRIFSLGHQSIVPDLLFIYAFLIIFKSGTYQAMVGCWGIGFIKDVTTVVPLGSYALTFGVMAMVIIVTREYLSGQRPVIMILLVFILSILVEQSAYWITVIKGVDNGGDYIPLSIEICFAALFTGALTPLGNLIMNAMSPLLGLPKQQQNRAGF